MPRKNNGYLLLIIVILSYNTGNAQQITTYNLQHLPQRSYMNPAFAPHGKVHAGIPLISGIAYHYSNNGFRYSDLFRKNENGTLYLDAGNAVSALKNRNHLSFHLETELLSIGIKAGKNYFTLNATEKADINFSFSKSLMTFLYEGNAATMGTVQQFNPSVEALHYREYGLTWAREWTSGIRGGIKVKYLYGMENALNKGSGATLYTDPTDFTLSAGTDFTGYTSGLDTSSFGNFDFSGYAYVRNNHGYGIDAGLVVKAATNIEISASVIDLGRIRFTEGNSIYRSHTRDDNFTYSGINLDEFINNDNTNAEQYIQHIGDSLYESFNLTTSHETYTYVLPAQVYLAGTYHLTPRYKLTGLVRNKALYHGNITDFHLSFTGKSKTWLNYTVGIGKINKAPVSIGAGFTLNFHNNQVYFVSDNVPGIFSWKTAYSTGFRAGINIMFGTRLKYMKPVTETTTGTQAQ